MATGNSWCGAAALVTVLALSEVAAPGAARAGDNLLQPEFSDGATFTAAADGALPDAPDLDSIPFFSTPDHAAYFRIDTGFGALAAGDALTANGRFNPTLSGPVIAGVGIGYKFGFLLRGDVTAEYRSRARVRTPDGIHAHLSGANVMANVYADIGTWYGVTPYIGAGAGIGWDRFSRHDAFGSGGTRSGFVWALMGGFAVEVTPSVTIDVGYRYLDAGTRRAPGLALKESGSHDLRIGLRWRFGATADAASLP
ncbi:opacity protein-like surface antigen [Pseudochelatococcus lubricantis]|uniref:Opacity protein-like surface antigen n=1 Tax=Pseudochelatococcus lubricantis TaxID=1538102 RepID=A0ABX0V2V8_9HYPH|nr:outer membrane beta-barrel protein [Pseudochelatococcus lubricantis]NIJ59467.1 opacity protein-like surface antigen [Pseudochelatococcus lubricantis]